MFSKVGFLLISLIVAFSSSAQNKFRNEWLVGIKNIKLTFNNDSCFASIAILGDSLPYKDAGFSSICDSNGNLFIGTNCVKVWNFKTGKIIEGAKQINNDTIGYYMNGFFVPNISIILPMPNQLYYIFITTASDEKYTHYRNSLGKDTFDFDEVRYSLVDMKQNNGEGKVIIKNKLLLHVGWPWLMKANFTAVQHANGRDWWLIKPCARDKKHQKYSFLIQPDSITTFYEEQAPYTNKIAMNDGVGQSCFNKNGDLYAEIGLNTPIALYNFDRCSGILNLKRVIDVAPYLQKVNGSSYPTNSGLCFSPNSKYLYFTDFNFAYQVDINNANDADAIKCISVYDKDSFNFPGYETMQLTPFNQIVLGSWNGTSNCSNAIMNPDEYGMACNFKEDYLCTNLHLINPKWVGTTGMPNMPFYDNGALAGSPCDTIREQVANWLLYPNPAPGFIKLKVPNSLKGASMQLQVFNLLGQKIVDKQVLISVDYEATLDVASLARSIYIVKAKYGTQEFISKFLKE